MRAALSQPPSERRALLFALLVVLVGAAFGVGGFYLERATSYWRPDVTRTDHGWRVLQKSRGPDGLALAGDRLAWQDGVSILLMDLRSGRVKLLGPGPAAHATWEPAMSDEYVVWFEAASADSPSATAWTYDISTRRRTAVGSLDDVLSLPSVSGGRAAWCTAKSGRAPRILSVDLDTGTSVTVASETGEPVIDGDLVVWAAHAGTSGIPGTWAVSDLAQRRRWTVVPAASAANAHLYGYDLSGRTLVWGQNSGESSDRIVAQSVDGGAVTVVADRIALATAPSIDGTTVVWGETATDGEGRVMGRRLGNGQPFVIAVVQGAVLATVVSGDTVAWMARSGEQTWVETASIPR